MNDARLPRRSDDLRRFVAAPLCASFALLLVACGVPNNPNPPGSEGSNTYFTVTEELSPKYLDPTSSYSVNETPYLYSVYEAPLSYHYLKRPYQLIPRLAEEIPVPRYLDKDGHELPADAPGETIAESVYDLKIRRGVLFAPHPAFAKNPDGSFVYRKLRAKDLAGKFSLMDFPQTGTRELVADDFVYGIKRMATPRIKSSAFSVMNEYIVGMTDYAKKVKEVDAQLHRGLSATERDLPFLDFREIPFEGATALDDHTVRIRVVGKYPQFKYWLAMTFFAPVPWEAEEFYAQPGMAEHNLSLNYWPAGTGPFMATEYIENRQHTMVRNPNYRGTPYPCEGAPGDREAGLLDDCGKTMPFLDKIVIRIEKEQLPMKSKWRQGYLDEPDLDHLEWGMQFETEARDSPATAREFKEKGFHFPRAVENSNWYLGFNWLDPIVGKGKTPEEQERHRKLRSALQIAVDWDEYAQLFEPQGKSGPPAMGPLPPAVFGARQGKEGMNPYAYDWKIEPNGEGRPQAARAGAETDGRGRLSRRSGRQDRPAVDPQLRLPAHPHAGDPRGDRVDDQAVRQARHPAGVARDRLQPLPGQDEHGVRTDLLLGLERRLSRRGKLPVPVLRSELESAHAWPGRERRELPECRLRQALREDALHGRRAREAGDDRSHGRDRPARLALAVGVQPLRGRVVSAVDVQREAQLHDQRPAALSPDRSGDAREPRARVESTALLAAVAARPRVPARPVAGLARVQGA
jgi:ABC-type transport system substrate-binding protein